MYYYAMSTPEILVLLFILSLWILSIFCCFRRYEKINTIERADVPSSALLTARNYQRKASVGTTASLVSIKNNLKSNMTGFAARDSEAFDNNQQSFIASEGCSSRMRFSDVVFNYQRRRVSGPDSLNYFYTSEVNSNEKNNLTPIKNKRYFKQPNMTRQAKRYAQAIRKEDRYDNEFQMIKASTSNSNFRGPEAFSDYQTSVIKSSSVPNFQRSEDLGEIETALNAGGEYQQRNSVNDETQDVVALDLDEANRKQSLIDPNLIPYTVRKNLIGLHQKSMLNLSHKLSTPALHDDLVAPRHGHKHAKNTSLNTSNFGPRNNLLKKYTGNQTSMFDLTKASALRI